MRITYVTRSFLDYRVPVYEELNKLVDGKLIVIYYGDVVPERVNSKIANILGENAIALSSELRLTGEKIASGSMANTGVRILYQPGLIKVISRSEPDVLLTDGFFQWTYAALWLRAIKKIPHVVCYERTAYTERNAQWYRVAYRKFAMRLTDAMCCNGKLCVDYAQWLGMPVERITTGYTVADTEGLQQKLEVMCNEESERFRRKMGVMGLVFLYVGRLISLKGVRYLLEAWARFEETKPGAATLLIVGDGPEGPLLRDLSVRLKLEAVRFVGSVDYDKIFRFYAAADVFIIPTLEDNWSLVVPEAMACGLPILCSKYNGCWPELVHNGENGWVFDPLDSRDMVDCLNKCLLAREKLPEMGKKSRQIVSNYTAKDAAEAILNACEIAMRQRTNKGCSL